MRPRVEIIDHKENTLLTGRDLGQLRQQLERIKIEPRAPPPAWASAAQKWERFGLTGWTFGDVPERITVVENPSTPIPAWPGLQLEDGHVNLRLFPTSQAARSASVVGVRRLIEIAIQKDLGWLQKDLRALFRFEPLLAGLGASEQIQAAAFEHLKRYVLAEEPTPPLSETRFSGWVESARKRLIGLTPRFLELLETVLKLRYEPLRRYPPLPTPRAPGKRNLSDLKQLGSNAPAKSAKPEFIAAELESLLPVNFLEKIPFEHLAHVPRYLKALLIRAERAALNPVKDRERAGQIGVYIAALGKLQAAPAPSAATRKTIETFRWMIEEFKVSVFAQELGTAMPVSPKRLDEQLAKIRREADSF